MPAMPRQAAPRLASPRHALGYIFGPPGWSHDGSRDTSHTLKAKWRARMEAGAGEGAPPQ